MIGPLEIVILLVIVLLATGAYKKLPALGRSAGSGLRSGSEKAREIADANAPKAKELADRVGTRSSEVGTKVGDRIDPEDIGRKAGKGLREARDMRSSIKGFLDPPPKSESAPAAKPTPAPAAKPAPEPVDDEATRDSETPT